MSEIGYHGGKVKLRRPRVRDRAGKEVRLETWDVLRDGNLPVEWALNLMVLNVSTRKYRRAVRLPEGDLPGRCGDGTSKSAISRRFVVLSRRKMREWLSSDLSELDLLVIHIDGLDVGDHVLVTAVGVDGNGGKHVLAVLEGATENTVVVQALLDNLIDRGLDPSVPRLFIVDGAKALSRAIRSTFGIAAAIQRCQVHKGRNIIERLPRAPARERQEGTAPGLEPGRRREGRATIAQPRPAAGKGGAGCGGQHPGEPGRDSQPLSVSACRRSCGARSPAPTSIDKALGTIRLVSRDVKRWRSAEMAPHWTATGMLEAKKTCRRLEAYRQLPILPNALHGHMRRAQANSALETIIKAASPTQPAMPASRTSTENGASP